jgi:hypothetical protein
MYIYNATDDRSDCIVVEGLEIPPPAKGCDSKLTILFGDYNENPCGLHVVITDA